MHYGEIKKCDIANGEGVRVSLFVSGCTHHCPGCFNQDTWEFDYGKEYTQETEEEILTALAPGYINGLSLLGGEPFEPRNQEVLVRLLRKVKERCPEKNICATADTFSTKNCSVKAAQDVSTQMKCFPCWTCLWTGGLWKRLKTSVWSSGGHRTSG